MADDRAAGGSGEAGSGETRGPFGAYGPSCGVCGRSGAAWLHHLDTTAAVFDVHGKQHVWADPLGMCARCEGLYRAGDDEGLAAVDERAQGQREDPVIRRSLAALRAADLGAVEVARWLPPGTTDLAAGGFVPVEFLTGGLDVPAVWPEPHRRSVPETRSDRSDEGDGLIWLVRSPWPAVPAGEAVALMWDWVEQSTTDRPEQEYDAGRERARCRDFLGRDQAWVLEYRRRRG